MVYHYYRRISGTFRFFIVLSITVIAISFSAGCGGGGSPSVQVSGTLVDGFGAVVSHPNATVTLVGTGEVAHPNSSGGFLLSAKPGTYTLSGSLVDPDAAMGLGGSRVVTLIEGTPLDVGLFPITNNTLDIGWGSYRQGLYLTAEEKFTEYLNNIRSGQANLGGSSALSGLGWTRGRGLDNPAQAAQNFREAIDGWSGNTDALVGLAACELGTMKSSGGFRFNPALDAITKAIDVPGDYSSAPTHDQISEIDLHAYHSFIDFLNGNNVSARSEAQSIQEQVAIGGSRASAGVVAIVLAFTE